PRGIAIELRGGDHERARLFEMTEEDSGTATSPIVYRAYRGESAHLRASRLLSGFEAVDDPAVLARLHPRARKKVRQADLRSLGIEDLGTVRAGGIELFYADEPMALARWPNEGFVKISHLAG